MKITFNGTEQSAYLPISGHVGSGQVGQGSIVSSKVFSGYVVNLTKSR